MIPMTKRVVEEVYSVNSPSFYIALLRNKRFSTVLYVCVNRAIVALLAYL